MWIVCSVMMMIWGCNGLGRGPGRLEEAGTESGPAGPQWQWHTSPRATNTADPYPVVQSDTWKDTSLFPTFSTFVVPSSFRCCVCQSLCQHQLFNVVMLCLRVVDILTLIVYVCRLIKQFIGSWYDSSPTDHCGRLKPLQILSGKWTSVWFSEQQPWYIFVQDEHIWEDNMKCSQW